MTEDCHESGVSAVVRHYVLTWDNEAHDVSVVGQFPSEMAAADWGEAWQRTHGDNPCWSVVTLADGHPMARLSVAPARDETTRDEASDWRRTGQLRHIDGYTPGYLEELWVHVNDGGKVWRAVEGVPVDATGQPTPRTDVVF